MLKISGTVLILAVLTVGAVAVIAPGIATNLHGLAQYAWTNGREFHVTTKLLR